jgi:DNA (cytosine-5)-methyltransferase 1
MFTVFDGYCGAGGSSSGAEQVPGVTVRYAVNHWDLAIQTHNANMPHVDHDRIDMTDDVEGDPRRYARTDLAWFSPECTTWSDARGEECDFAVEQRSLLDDDEPVADEATARSRFQMETVPIFVGYHRYLAFVVENVTNILKWRELDRWLAELDSYGYRHRIVILNSAFAHQLGAPAPQLRDRVYFVFWQTRFRTPDFDRWTRPNAWCPTCEATVRGVYVPKPGPRRKMLYRAQYTFRCPSVTCRNAEVQPFVLPAAAAIDWSLPAQRIGDRVKALRPKTLARIEAGLRRHGGALLSPAGGSRRRDASPVTVPMPARTTTENDALVAPFLLPLRSGRERSIPVDHPLATIVANGSNHALVEQAGMLVPVEGRAEVDAARPVNQPGRAQTARLQDALVVPLRNHGVAFPAGSGLLPTFAARGTHHALVMRNNKPRGGADGGNLSTPVDEPLRTITTAGHQSLIGLDHLAASHLVYAYDTGHLQPLAAPLPTQTTVQGDGLLGAAIAVEDCTFRMLDVHEIRSGMAFQPTFLLPFGAKRDRVKMLGNAVTPPAARDLFAAIVEAITGQEVA